MVTGMLDLAELARLASAGEIETVVVAFADPYGRLMGKRFDVDFFLQHVAKSGTHACDYLLTVDMEMNPVAGYTFANWHKGYGDVHLVPDWGTLRRAAWLPATAWVLADIHDAAGNSEVSLAPRSILKRQLARARDHGYTTLGASELEFYVFRDSFERAAGKNYADLEPLGWYLEDYHLLQGTRQEGLQRAVRRALKQSGVPPESSKGEWGLGQHELNIECADALTMADRHVLLKQCLKEVADEQGLSVTFMAKFAAERAGSSCHLHLSLWRGEEAAFAGDRSIGHASCSDTFLHFLGGWIEHAAEMMVFYAPTVNSYKRFQVASWAPTRLAWSQDNRTAGFRIVGHGKSLRIECRIPGADCNPYLAFAASIASGLDGIARRTEPPPAFVGDVYASDVPHVPRTLREATDIFARSEFARRAFGDDVVEHYSHFYRTEQAAYDQAVTDWERRRYFERI